MSAREHRDLDAGLIAAALVLALSTGFASAVVLGLALGDRVPIGPWWPAVVQAHGHAQLFGWTALFILGVGFYFLPRMRGSPLQRGVLVPVAGVLLTGGVALRFVSQTALALRVAWMPEAALAASAILEVAAVACALVILGSTLANGPPLRTRAGVLRILPFLAPAFFSFGLAAIVNAAGALRATSGQLSPIADRVTVELMLHGFVVPIALGISVQTLPLFLRLPATRTRTVQVAAVVHAALVAVRIVSLVVGAALVRDVAIALSSLVVIAFVLWLDVVFRVRTPWTADREQAYVLGDRAPMRPGMPDRGEFGRFEWLVRGAYGWLLAAALLELAGAAGLSVSRDAGRHALTMGFVSLLIGGMAVRMIPGFSKRPLARVPLVTALAACGHAAALLRVAPLLLPPGPATRVALALSGGLAWIFVALLAVLLAPLLAPKR